jgi:hypothetical protein
MSRRELNRLHPHLNPLSRRTSGTIALKGEETNRMKRMMLRSNDEIMLLCNDEMINDVLRNDGIGERE